MNYIELINNFWIVDTEARFASVDVHLYFNLLRVCNSLAWRNPFYQSNGQLTGALGISEKTLIAAKKRLQETGLIKVEGGDSRRKSSLYYLTNPCNKYSSYDSSLVSRSGNFAPVLNKLNQTKLNNDLSNGKTTVSQHTPEGLNKSDFKEDLLESGITTPLKEEKPLNGKFYKNNSTVKGSKEEKKQAAQFIKPTLEEVTAYCSERKNSINPEQWLDYYSANGWKVGKNSMKDWKATIRTWERNEYSSPKNTVPITEKKKVYTGTLFLPGEEQISQNYENPVPKKHFTGTL